LEKFDGTGFIGRLSEENHIFLELRKLFYDGLLETLVVVVLALFHPPGELLLNHGDVEGRR